MEFVSVEESNRIAQEHADRARERLDKEHDLKANTYLCLLDKKALHEAAGISPSASDDDYSFVSDGSEHVIRFIHKAD